jgi:hypothetical protein
MPGMPFLPFLSLLKIRCHSLDATKERKNLTQIRKGSKVGGDLNSAKDRKERKKKHEKSEPQMDADSVLGSAPALDRGNQFIADGVSRPLLVIESKSQSM